MIRVLKEKLHKAKKDYVCSACYIMLSIDDFEYLCADYDLTSEEIESFIKAKENNFMIKKGDIYLYQVGIYNGDFYLSKVIPEIHEICLKRGFYNED